MNKQENYKNILDNYFTEREITIGALSEILTDVGPVFGTIEYKTEKAEDGETKLIFVDNDVYQSVLKPDGTEVNKETDLSSIVSTMYLDEKNVISVLEHGFGIFTPVNKEKVLVITSLIGKTVVF